jgi:ABC-2 type transport system permease protein
MGIYFRLISVQIRSQMQYRMAFVVETITTLMLSVTSFLTLAFVIQRFGNIAGWTLGEVAFLYGMAETSFGVMDLLFSGFDPGNFGRQTRLGQFDQLLLRPVGLTVQVFGSQFLLRRIGRIAQGAAVLIFAFSQVQLHWTFLKVLYLPVVIASMVAFFGGLFIIGATITFWTLESIEIVNIFTYGGTEMISYPMSIYQDWLRHFFTFIIPAIFLNYYPALYFLDKPDPLGFPALAAGLAPLAGFGVLAAALAFWRYGVQHYQSTGT